MEETNRIRRKKRINVTIALFCIWFFCIVLYYFFIYFVVIPLKYSIIIISSETFLCLAMWTFFMIKIDWLKDMNTGREITYLNISNILSAIRFSLVPLLITMFGLLAVTEGNFKFRIAIFSFTVLVCLTDLFDGILARRLNQVTKLGMVLDPIGDFLMIICFSILIFVNHIIAWWFFVLIMIRIPGLIIVALFCMAVDIKIRLNTTFLGRATIFYILGQFGVSTIKLLLDIHNSYYDIFLLITQIIGSILIISSSAEKIIQLRHFIKIQDQLSKENIQF